MIVQCFYWWIGWWSTVTALPPTILLETSLITLSLFTPTGALLFAGSHYYI